MVKNIHLIRLNGQFKVASMIKVSLIASSEKQLNALKNAKANNKEDKVNLDLVNARNRLGVAILTKVKNSIFS